MNGYIERWIDKFVVDQKSDFKKYSDQKSAF